MAKGIYSAQRTLSEAQRAFDAMTPEEPQAESCRCNGCNATVERDLYCPQCGNSLAHAKTFDPIADRWR